MGIEDDLRKAKSIVEKDLAKDNELHNLEMIINDLETKLKDTKTEYDEKRKEKTQKLNAEIRQLFKTAFNRPELQLSEKDFEIKASANDKIYAVQFKEKVNYLYRKRKDEEKRFAFRYRNNVHVTGYSHSRDEFGNEIVSIKAEMAALEKYLEKCNEELQSIDKDGLYIEYARIASNPIKKSINNNGRGKDDISGYTKIEMGNLLHLIQ